MHWMTCLSLALPVLAAAAFAVGQPATTAPTTRPITLDYDTPIDAALQSKLDAIHTRLRTQFGIADAQAACGVMDLLTGRLALIHPDRVEYAASTAKVGILYAYFATHPDAADRLDPTVRHELGDMAKASSNDMAAKYSQLIGLERIQQLLNEAGFYDAKRGGGIWVGKHYGIAKPRVGDPVGDNSHAATVRQLMRFFVLLEQGQLLSPQASRAMRDIFASPDIPHDDIKFVKALRDRPGVEILRKWGSWEDWLHDSAVITAPGRHYVLVALTKHPKGDDYLVELARAVDDVMQGK